MLANAFFSSSKDIPIKFRVVNLGKHLLQEKKTLVNPSESIPVAFIKLTIVENTEANKLTALHNTDEVKCGKTFFHRFHKSKMVKKCLRWRKQIELNGADFAWEFVL